MSNSPVIGLYEKALPEDYDLVQKLITTKSLGFDFMELSIDESDERINRLLWSRRKRASFITQIQESETPVPSICLSVHRRYPLGSHDPHIRSQALDLLNLAIDFAADIGIRTIQLAGYDLYYEQSDHQTVQWFYEGLKQGLRHAAAKQVMLSMEMMDTNFMNSVVKFLLLKKKLPSQWLGLYPDVGNLSAWNLDVLSELELGLGYATCIHLKDTLAVGPDSPGTFKGVAFGNGCVDFISIFRKLTSMKYGGPFLIEMWSSSLDDPLKEVKQARLWMLEQMRSAGFISVEPGTAEQS